MTDFSTYLQVRGRGWKDSYGLDEAPEVLAWARRVTREGSVDMAAIGSEAIDLGEREVEVLHVPGHTHGHLAAHDKATGALVISDAALGSVVPNADGSGAFASTYRYVEEYLATLARLQDMRAPLLLTGHYPTYIGNEVEEFLDESTEFLHDLGRRVESALGSAKGGCTPAEVVDVLDDGFGDWPVGTSAGALAFPVVGHVEDLLARGRAIVEDRGRDRATIKAVA